MIYQVLVAGVDGQSNGWSRPQGSLLELVTLPYSGQAPKTQQGPQNVTRHPKGQALKMRLCPQNVIRLQVRLKVVRTNYGYAKVNRGLGSSVGHV